MLTLLLDIPLALAGPTLGANRARLSHGLARQFNPSQVSTCVHDQGEAAVVKKNMSIEFLTEQKKEHLGRAAA